ncbi:MAG: MEDS domain-containing protein [Ardenticatenales bacterium]|nr:MEDS domain-containing protein [Ardenticatenales bacterium]
MIQTKQHDTAREGKLRGDAVLQARAPSVDWSMMGNSEHFAQFYESDSCLLESLSGFIATGLRLGEGTIIIATAAHLTALEKELQARWLDVESLRAAGQYVALDAAEMLSTFIVEGWPHPERFAEVIGGLMAQMTAHYPRVRAFGEMVALLWAEGNQDAAVRLEALWNELQKSYTFCLFCAYPMHGFDGEALIQPLNHVCDAHSHIIPAESYNALDTSDARLREILRLQQQARLLKAEVAERQEAEAALRAMKEQLERQVEEAEQANRMKDEFLATVSHELRTPLTTILGWLHRLNRGRRDEATLERGLAIIERSAKVQAQLIEDMLDVSRIITGKLRLSISPVDAATVINAAIDSVQLAADARDIQLLVTVDPSARHLAGDANRLQQVFWNLLSNAIKFTPTGGQVRVLLERVGSAAQISVSDSGEGIDPHFLPFIFDRFRQADGTSTRRHGGLGLGLAIVRHLVELHGGTVRADSAGEGHGATFSVLLPLVLSQKRVIPHLQGGGYWHSPAEEITPLQTQLPLIGVKVLLVDDDEDILQLLSDTLTECGATLQMASSVPDALDRLTRYQPDVLVSDLAMPGEDGYSLIGKVRALDSAHNGQIPAIALTAYARVEDHQRALAAGFNMFVPKPVDPDELITIIAALAK